MKAFALLSICLLSLSLGACRYQTATGEQKRLSIGIIKNTTFENELTPLVRTELARRIMAKTTMRVVSESEARKNGPDLHLEGVITGFSRNSLREDNFDQTEELRLTVHMAFTLLSPDGERVWVKRFTGDASYLLGGERVARKQAVDDIVIKLVHALLPMW